MTGLGDSSDSFDAQLLNSVTQGVVGANADWDLQTISENLDFDDAFNDSPWTFGTWHVKGPFGGPPTWDITQTDIDNADGGQFTIQLRLENARVGVDTLILQLDSLPAPDAAVPTNDPSPLLVSAGDSDTVDEVENIILGSGDDIVRLGGTDQTVTGNDGNDRYEIQDTDGGGLTITDFESGEDKLVFDNVFFKIFPTGGTYDELKEASMTVGSDSIVQLGDGQTLTIKNVDIDGEINIGPGAVKFVIIAVA